MPVEHVSAIGQSLYAMFNDGTDATAVDLTEGTGDLRGFYTATDTEIADAGLASGDWIYRVFVGTAATKDPTDTLDGGDSLSFNGAGENKPNGVTADDIGEEYTFRFPRSGSGVLAGNRVEVNAGFNASIAFDVAGIIEAKTTIASVSSVTVSDSGATVGSIVLHKGKRKFMCPLSSVTTTGIYTVTATFATVDSQTLIVRGTLVVK